MAFGARGVEQGACWAKDGWGSGAHAHRRGGSRGGNGGDAGSWAGVHTDVKEPLTDTYPAMAALFPKLVPSVASLRAHKVAILKYHTSHPQTDVHVDDGILALTCAGHPANEPLPSC